MDLLIFSDKEYVVKLAKSSLIKILSPNQYSIKSVSTRELGTDAWHDSTSLLIFPGGNPSLVKSLQIDKIKTFVEDGGYLIGFGSDVVLGEYLSGNQSKNETPPTTLTKISKLLIKEPNDQEVTINGNFENFGVTQIQTNEKHDEFAFIVRLEDDKPEKLDPICIKKNIGKGGMILCGLSIFPESPSVDNDTKTSVDSLQPQILELLSKILNIIQIPTIPTKEGNKDIDNENLELKPTSMYLVNLPSSNRNKLNDILFEDKSSKIPGNKLFGQLELPSTCQSSNQKVDYVMEFEMNDNNIESSYPLKDPYQPKVYLCNSESYSKLPQSIHNFDISTYNKNLKTKDTGYFGRCILYAEGIPSTQTIIESNWKLRNILPEGTVITAKFQTAGRGRAGNTWISPLGSLSFSYLFSAPIELMTVTQYIIALSMVEAIYDGLGLNPDNVGINNHPSLPIKIKWPNDIYANHKKISGILVGMSVLGSNISFLAGVGLNVDNELPSYCLNKCIDEFNESNSTSYQHLTKEQVLALFLNRFELNMDECKSKGWNPNITKKYYKHWMHSNQIVSIMRDNHSEPIRAVIRGVSTNGLIVESMPSSKSLSSIPSGLYGVEAEHTSFDMLKTLVKSKNDDGQIHMIPLDPNRINKKELVQMEEEEQQKPTQKPQTPQTPQNQSQQEDLPTSQILSEQTPTLTPTQTTPTPQTTSQSQQNRREPSNEQTTSYGTKVGIIASVIGVAILIGTYIFKNK
eukprot:TRINITY_DN2867_c0_g3_i1.p1 TRINITY_DN2867_c0_g3~~TRINITY_DN2867_c0_g3_i1.p1  ORF type:complete len:751 (+),score=155.81 TRINITY_DN2867_c0_g3_i1:23-2254(+)